MNLGAIDLDKYKDFGGKYGIQGFPTLKFFGANKNKPIDYQQQRTASAIVDFCLGEARSAVQERLSGPKPQAKPQAKSKTEKKATPGKAREGSNTLEELTESEFRNEVLKSDD